MVGGVKRRKHQQRSTQGGAAQRCLKWLMWVDVQMGRCSEVQMGESQKTWALVLSQKMPSLSLFWVFLRSNCFDPIVGDMIGFRMADNDSNEADGPPQPPQWCYPC